MEDIMVSVVCLAYNHEKYVEHAIRSIANQETTFPFEILVNDDASTDGTPEILKNLEKEYDNLRVIYQPENLYSKGVRATPLLIEQAKGKYIAFCECDDYWVDAHKLQKQVEALEKNENCVACIHPAYRVRENDEKIVGVRQPRVEKETLSIKDMILCVGENYALNSLVCRRKNIADLGELYYQCAVGDIPIALHLALAGDFMYLPKEIMSAYRVGAVGSWTRRLGKDSKKREKYLLSVLATLDKVDAMTDGQWADAIQDRKRFYTFQLDCINLSFIRLLLKYPRRFSKLLRICVKRVVR